MTAGDDSALNVRGNVRKLYAYWFFHSLIFAYVIENLFGLARGLTIQEMVYLEIIYAVVILLLEVPTGVIADRWSRKYMMVLSSIFIFFEFFVLIFAFNFWVFALSALCAAIGGALASGTSNAIFYDSLKTVGEEKNYEKVLGRNHLFDYTAGGIAALLGGLIAAKWGLAAPYWFSLIGTSLAFFITLTLHEPKNKTSTHESGFWRHIREATTFLRERKTLQFVILYGVMIAATWDYVDEYWQIYLQEISIPVALFGVYSVIAGMLHSVGGVFAHRLKNKFSYNSVFLTLLLVSAAAILAASVIGEWYGAAILLLGNITFGVSVPLVSGYLHHRVSSSHRATVDSLQSLLLRLAVIAVGLAFGYVSTRYSIFTGFGLLGSILLVYAAYYSLFQHRLRENVLG